MSNPTHYEIQRSSDNTNWIIVDYVEYGTNEYYFDNKGMGGITQYYRVKAVILSQPRTVYPKQTDLPLKSSATASDSISCVQLDNVPQYWEIEESTNGIDFTSLDITKNTIYFKQDRIAEQEYWFKIRGNNTPVLEQTNSPGTFTGEYSETLNIICGTIDLTKTHLYLVEIYDVFLQDNTVWRFTFLDQDIQYLNNLYKAIPGKRGDIKYHTNLQVDKATIETGIKTITVEEQDYDVKHFMDRDLLRDARILVRLIDYRYCDTELVIFEGWVTEGYRYNEGILYLEIGSILDRLNENFPKVLYNSFCHHRLYDTRCMVVKNNYKESGIVISNDPEISTRIKIYSDVFLFLNQPEGYFAPGEIKFTNGENTGISRSIFKHYDGYVELIFPYNNTPQDGDEFDVWPGCNKRGSTCEEKFNNYDNFFGFEFVPDPKILYTSLT